MKNHCIRCKERIDTIDFYMETKHGRICSSCLVRQQRNQEPTESIKKLLAKSGRPVQERSAAEKAADKLRLLSLDQLRCELS